MVLLLCLPIIGVESVEARCSRRVASLDLPRLLASGWTFKQIEDHLDLLENCQRFQTAQATGSLTGSKS
jgi:hypothetical protein